METLQEMPDLKIRRSYERGFEDFGWTDNWMTFSFANYHDPEWVNFGSLRVMIENHIQPHSGFPSHSHRDVEIVTYVASGILTHGGNFGHRADITSAEMQLISAGSRGMVHSEENINDDVEHNYQMWLIPNRPNTQFSCNQLNFSPEERKSRFRLYVSPDGRENSMPINTDALIYAGLFRSGDQIEYHLEQGRGAWIQIVNGQLQVTGIMLEQGDGVGITNASRLVLQFESESEVLLFDLGLNTSLLWR
jgi:redox-sensitive bicupin YhaK (pirin superfamily)